jgi:phage pi2 protein 07
MKKILLILITIFTIGSFAQKKQTILISSKYDFQEKKNSHNINNMLKAILTSNNYQVYFEDEVLPIEIAQNRCNALTGVLVDDSNVFVTKVKLQIKDCKNNILFETADVKSREKESQAAFIEVIKLLSPELKKYKPVVIQKKEVTESPSEIITNTNVKYQFVEIANGYAVMDATPKVILQIYKTTNPNIFIADKFGVKGVFTKLVNRGVFEYYLNDKLMVEEFLF